MISLAMPGLSHVVLGKPVRAAVVFALAFGLFFAGYGLCTDRIWFVGLDLGSLGFLPGNLHLLIPEILNPTPYLLAHTLQDLEGLDLTELSGGNPRRNFIAASRYPGYAQGGRQGYMDKLKERRDRQNQSNQGGD